MLVVEVTINLQPARYAGERWAKSQSSCHRSNGINLGWMPTTSELSTEAKVLWCDVDLTGHWCVFFPCFNLLKTCICKCHLWVDTVRKSGRSRFPQKFTLNLKVMDRGWRDHGWAESVYYPGNNQKIGETRMLLDRNFGFTYIQLQYMHIYAIRGVKDVKVSFCSRLGNGYPYVSFFFVVFFYFFLQGFLTQRPKGLISWSSQNTFKCEMFGENTWGSGVRSGSGCQQDDADTHQVGSKTCDQLLPWRIILGQICVSRWRFCRSWNRLLWDLQFFATSPTLILRFFFATGSLVLNSGSHFLVICGKIHSLRWSLHLGAAPYIRFPLLWVICFTKANPQDLMKRKDFSLIQASWWDFFRWFQSSFRWCIFTSFFNWWYLYTTVW